VALGGPALKLYIDFFTDLDRVISNFEIPYSFEQIEEKSLALVIP